MDSNILGRRDFLAGTFVGALVAGLQADEVPVWTRPVWGLQSWWTDGEGVPGHDSGHLHLDTDFPVGYGIRDYDGKITTPPLSGKVPFSVYVTIHDAPIGTKLTTTSIYSEPLHKVVRTITWNKVIESTDNVSYSWTGDLDTVLGGYNGRQEYRFLTKLNRPDGNSLRVTSGLQAYVSNPGKTEKHSRPEYWQECRGWYNDLNYENARFLSGIPRKPIRGLWLPTVQLTPGSGGSDVTSFWVVLDPQNHFFSPGTMIFQGTDEYKGLISVDCRTLSSGTHKLVLLTHAKDLVQNGTLTGVLVVPFEVE